MTNAKGWQMVRLSLAVLLTCAIQALSHAAETVTLGFASPMGPPFRVVREWTEGGFRLSAGNDNYQMSSNGKDINSQIQYLQSWPSNGTDYFGILDYPGVGPVLTRLDGKPFKPLSIDLAEYSKVFVMPKNIEFMGLRPDKSAIGVTFTLDGIMDADGGASDFQTFEFPESFGTLSQLVFMSVIFALDNLKAEVVPEPSTISLIVISTILGAACRSPFSR